MSVVTWLDWTPMSVLTRMGWTPIMSVVTRLDWTPQKKNDLEFWKGFYIIPILSAEYCKTNAIQCFCFFTASLLGNVVGSFGKKRLLCSSGHRIRTVHAFAMVVLEILGTKIPDSGTYTCRATNKWGQAEISVDLDCVDKESGMKPRFTKQIQVSRPNGWKSSRQ